MESRPLTDEAVPTSRTERWLPAPRLPRPLRWMLAAVTWPLMGVLVLVGGTFGIAAGIGVVLVALAVVYVLAAAGVHGFAGLADRPLAFIPHNLLTLVSVAVPVPLVAWWLRDDQR